ncbi:MAG: TraB/GumN family protein, partial [Casimicrobium sp.]
KNGKTATLFGSLHVGQPDFYPVPQAVRSRFDAAEVVAVEADVTRDDTRIACNKLAATNDKLQKLLPEEEMQLLNRYAQASGLDLTKLDGRKLWMVNLILTVTELRQLGVDFEDGVDLVITRESHFQKKKVIEIEGQKQCASLAGADGPEAVAGLNRFLTSVRENKMEKRINDMIAAYRIGDGDAIAKITVEEFGDTPVGKRSRLRVFDDRHAPMAETIDGYLSKNEKHFIAIGVAHMFGTSNLLQALEKRGIKVTPVKADSVMAAPAKADAPKEAPKK